MAENTLVMNVSSINNSIILGGTSSFNINVQNIDTTNKLYNLSLSLTLPDGLSLSVSTLPQTSSITNSDNSVTYNWTNIKDLAAMEIDYNFSITVKSNTTLKNGTVIPFNYSFTNINLRATVDTMPRGTYDAGNEIFTALKLLSFLTIEYTGTITTSSKVLKGAGTSISANDASQINTSTVQILNNSYSLSTVNISIILEDGIRYLANLTASGTDASKFSSPIIRRVLIDGIYYTEIYFSAVTLSKSSITTLRFSFAVWNRYNNNTGSIIYHGTRLNMAVRMGVYSSSSYSVNNLFSFSAMDLIITNSINNSLVDINSSIIYTFIFRLGQYYNLSNVTVSYYIPDGINYISTSYAPTSVVDNPQRQGYVLTYNFNNKLVNSSTTVTINASVNANYRYKLDASSIPLPVVAYDNFTSTASVYGNAYDIPLDVSDTSNASCRINIASIKKNFIRGYYRDGSPKAIQALAPNDTAEFTLNYNAANLRAKQKEISIADFFPLSANPINNLTYTYGGFNPILTPQLISPHGVNFYYGDITGNSTASINFRVPISILGSPPQNINLMKLTGINTSGYSYSARDQVTINIGSPNLRITKSVSGPNTTAIKSSETYIYTVTISNTNNLGTETDAFSFTLRDNLSSWFTLNPESIAITGTGSFSSYNYTSANINVLITKLQPGSSLTLTYTVTLRDNIPPGLTITTSATNTNPYSQIYDAALNNFQYTDLIKTASASISSQAITLVKTNNTDTFKVGSPILYTIKLTIPLGTIIYNSSVRDTLPTGQSYIGPAYRNNVLITPAVSAQTITFSTNSVLDARNSAQTITYLIYCRINNAVKTQPNYTTTAINTCQVSYRQSSSSGSLITINRNLSVIINHPNIILSLLATDLTTNISSNSSLSITNSSRIAFNLTMYNNSNISLINGSLEIPINENFDFNSLTNTFLCSASYQTSPAKIIVTIPNLPPKSYGQLTFILIPKASLSSGTFMTTTANVIRYYNDISTTKVYDGGQSNTITCTLQPALTLLPDPLTRINDSTSYTVTAPGNTAVINNYFTNTGGGTDSFSLRISQVSINYSLSIDGIKIAVVPSNTAYSANLDVFRNLPPNTKKTITITALIPSNSPLGARYDFNVTVTSLTSPYPSKTVLNIDPN